MPLPPSRPVIEVEGRRSVSEWIGSNPDAAVPPHVRLRVFERCGGTCHISGRKIRAGEPWELDHILPLRDGGEHRESNLAPALADKHRVKTAAENSERARINRKKAANLGVKPKGRGFRGWRRFDGTIVYRGEK
jgi:5-methylcytosine-specific restriction endonuclease McrA